MKVGVKDDQVEVALQALHGALEEVVFGAAALWGWGGGGGAALYCDTTVI